METFTTIAYICLNKNGLEGMLDIMKIKTVAISALTIISLIVLSGCSSIQQIGAKQFGGSFTETLPANTKLVEVTWNQNHLWVLTRPMQNADKAETYTFKESAVLGVLEGTVTIIETKR